MQHIKLSSGMRSYAINRSVVCLHSIATATAAEKSLREEQEEKAEAERQVQLIEQKMSGELVAML